MKTLTLIVLLVTSQFAVAVPKVSAAELDCVTKSVYHEARSLKPIHWLKRANVAYNRKLDYANFHYGASRSDLCAITRSKHYSSRRFLKKPIFEKKVYANIRHLLMTRNWYNITDALYFSDTKKGAVYLTEWKQ